MPHIHANLLGRYDEVRILLIKCYDTQMIADLYTVDITSMRNFMQEYSLVDESPATESRKRTSTLRLLQKLRKKQAKLKKDTKNEQAFSLARDGALQCRHNKLIARAMDMDNRERDLLSRESVVTRRECVVTRRESVVTLRESKLDTVNVATVCKHRNIMAALLLLVLLIPISLFLICLL